MLSLFGVAWAESSGSSSWDNYPTSIVLLVLIDFFVLMYILHKIYHAIFHVIYFGIGAYFNELFVIGGISGFIVSFGRILYDEGNTIGAYAFFIVILFLPAIFRGRNKED